MGNVSSQSLAKAAPAFCLTLVFGVATAWQFFLCRRQDRLGCLGWKQHQSSLEDSPSAIHANTEELGPRQAKNDLEDLASNVHVRPPMLGLGEVLRRVRGQQVDPEAETLSTETARLPGRQRIHVKTFGCPHNQSDGEYLAGQLQDYGYTLVETLEESDAIVINSCTVKHPSETRALNLVTNAQQAGKGVVLAGCVPSSNKKLAQTLTGVSMLDVTQLDRIVEVVEETVKGNTVQLLDKRGDLPSLSLPKVRKHRFAEIITINAGCLGNCTYCKTKMSRGKVVSYPIDAIIARALEAASEGVCQIELASEDMGAFGLDIGTNIAELLVRLSDALPPHVMLRTGMTNPPFIMQHVDKIIEVLNRPNVHAFMHIPVQSGSDQVLRAMRREYTVGDFAYLADRLKAGVPELFLLTDIICGFPTESDEDWNQTMELCRKYQFQGIHISQFYARPGTAAARLKPLKSHVGKERYRELAELVTSTNRNEGLLGRKERVWFADTEEERSKSEQGQTVGRTKTFAKVLVPRDDALLGRSALVRITSTCRLHVEGQAAQAQAELWERELEEALEENEQLKVKLLQMRPLASQVSDFKGKIRKYAATIEELRRSDRRPSRGSKRRRLVRCQDRLPEEASDPACSPREQRAGQKETDMAASTISHFRHQEPRSPEPVPGPGSAANSAPSTCRDADKSTRPSPGAPNIAANAVDPRNGKNRWPLEVHDTSGQDAKPDNGQRENLIELRQIAGLRIWEPIQPPTEATNAVVASNLPADAERREEPALYTVGRSSSRSFEPQVRAEGQHAAPSPIQPTSGALCRCVVRGKEQRLALPGHDCEMCRRFYAAAGVGSALKSSRHRSEHAPTNTPPGFWDLSFPVHPESTP
ncbi:cdkal1 [Symbiodinium sp. CCMP2456]|nr:cdkal1 [Symbiodinium sp. CCMP2456]